jgi:hypothetical protein
VSPVQNPAANNLNEHVLAAATVFDGGRGGGGQDSPIIGRGSARLQFNKHGCIGCGGNPAETNGEEPVMLLLHRVDFLTRALVLCSSEGVFWQ